MFFWVSGGSGMRRRHHRFFFIVIISPFLLGQSTNTLYFEILSIPGSWLDSLFSFTARIFSQCNYKEVGLHVCIGLNGL